MKVLLFLNGSFGSQSGIEEGFNYLLKSDKISSLEWFYFEDYLDLELWQFESDQ